MSTEEDPKPFKISQEDFDTVQNRIQLALAKHENIVKSWIASSSRKEPTKTQEQLDAEDAALFRNEPPYLGVGALIPAEFLVSDAERNNKSLRAKLFPTKGLKGSKPRDSEEKAASAKRALNTDSSDEEDGRSSLGKAKKMKTAKGETEPIPVEHPADKIKHNVNDESTKDEKGDNLGITKARNIDDALATPPTTPEKPRITTLEIDQNTKVVVSQTEGTTANSIEVQAQKEKEVKPSKPLSEEMRQRYKEKRKLKKVLSKQQKQQELRDAKLHVQAGEALDQV
ncbi:hypothetical protein D0Z07_5866 [Hyphodiscus hymeniophilus]|uniref:Uncharacterized protein n=1 Tax=Hyphodiscus hymeniophilus TaxID=353542 RepID=A0A9P6VH34_9HELO|nr:hypothetical protein D0Z07_5866 [Hyphodiscus hymeniophilus]